MKIMLTGALGCSVKTVTAVMISAVLPAMASVHQFLVSLTLVIKLQIKKIDEMLNRFQHTSICQIPLDVNSFCRDY